MLKIRDNSLIDENNPSVIVGDPALEAVLGKKEVYVGEVRDIINRQLVISEPYRWPLPSNARGGGGHGLTRLWQRPPSPGRGQAMSAQPAPEFIKPVLGLKTSVFIKTSLKCSFSIEVLLRDAISSLF